MAQCKWCDRSGWLLTLTPLGLCSTCAPVVGLEVSQRLRIMKESMALAENGKTLATRLSRADLVIEHARALGKYHDRGIEVLTVAPRSIIEEFQRLRRALVVDGLRAEFKDAQRKAAAASSAKSRCSVLSKVLVHVQSFRELQPDLEDLGTLEGEIAAAILETQLSDHLDSARRFEFKGRKSKALDRYYEALYLLRHDSVPDTLQTSQIASIEAKIRELGGEVR